MSKLVRGVSNPRYSVWPHVNRGDQRHDLVVWSSQVHPSADCVVGWTTLSASRPGPLGRRWQRGLWPLLACREGPGSDHTVCRRVYDMILPGLEPYPSPNSYPLMPSDALRMTSAYVCLPGLCAHRAAGSAWPPLSWLLYSGLPPNVSPKSRPPAHRESQSPCLPRESQSPCLSLYWFSRVRTSRPPLCQTPCCQW